MKVFVIFKHTFLNETDDVTEQYTANSASAKLSLLWNLLMSSSVV